MFKTNIQRRYRGNQIEPIHSRTSCWSLGTKTKGFQLQFTSVLFAISYYWNIPLQHFLNCFHHPIQMLWKLKKSNEKWPKFERCLVRFVCQSDFGCSDVDEVCWWWILWMLVKLYVDEDNNLNVCWWKLFGMLWNNHTCSHTPTSFSSISRIGAACWWKFFTNIQVVRQHTFFTSVLHIKRTAHFAISYFSKEALRFILKCCCEMISNSIWLSKNR